MKVGQVPVERRVQLNFCQRVKERTAISCHAVEEERLSFRVAARKAESEESAATPGKENLPFAGFWNQEIQGEEYTAGQPGQDFFVRMVCSEHSTSKKDKKIKGKVNKGSYSTFLDC